MNSGMEDAFISVLVFVNIMSVMIVVVVTIVTICSVFQTCQTLVDPKHKREVLTLNRTCQSVVTSGQRIWNGGTSCGLRDSSHGGSKEN